MLLQILTQLAFFLLVGMVLDAVKLLKQADMNMKNFVAEYLFWWGLTRAFRMLLAFIIEQTSRVVTIVHTFLFIILQLLNLAASSYFFIRAMSMNEDMAEKEAEG